jgi:hypothetical protein
MTAPVRARRRVLLRPALASLAAAATLLALAPAAEASRSQWTMFDAPRELMSDHAETRESTLNEIRSLGVNWVRVILYWHSVAPNANSKRDPNMRRTDPRSYDWTRYERVINSARARGMNVLLTVSGPVPKWATRRERDKVTRPSPTQFRRFMIAAGRKFRTSVRYWAVWNEPNHPQFLKPQFTGRGSRRHAASPRIYRRLVRAARAGLDKSGNRRDRMLIGDTAPRGTSRVVAPVPFVRGTFCLTRSWHKRRRCGRLDVDGWAHHPYTTRRGPWWIPPQRGDVTIATLSRLRRALDRAGRARAVRRGLGMYLTEFGIQSRPDPFVGVSETKQAEYRSIAERVAWRNPRVRAFSQYLLRDDLPRAGRAYLRYGGFESGLRHSHGKRKRSHRGFRLPLAARRRGRRGVYLWGLVRPARGRTRVTVEYRNRRSRKWRRLKTDATNRRGYWSTTTRRRAGRRYRVRRGRHLGAPTRVYPR